MNYHTIKRKYKSLIISCIIHGLMVFLLMYFTLLQMTNEAPKPLEDLVPAPVSVQTPRPNQRRIIPLEDDSTEIASLESSIPYGEQMEQMNTIIAPYEEPATITESHESSETTEESLPKLSKRTEEGKLPSKEITTADLLKAFKTAMREEHPPTSTLSRESLVTQRLGKQWGQASYTSRVGQALNKSFRVHARIIRHHEYVNKWIPIDIVIRKDGTPADLGNQPLSGIPELDRWLRNTIQQTHFPPIPERFGTDTYHFSFNLHIILPDGAVMFGNDFTFEQR